MDWVLSILVLAGNFLLGRKIKWGWVILAVNSIGWVYYAYTLNPIQWGLIPSAVINFGICIMAIYNWFKE